MLVLTYNDIFYKSIVYSVTCLIIIKNSILKKWKYSRGHWCFGILRPHVPKSSYNISKIHLLTFSWCIFKKATYFGRWFRVKVPMHDLSRNLFYLKIPFTEFISRYLLQKYNHVLIFEKIRKTTCIISV